MKKAVTHYAMAMICLSLCFTACNCDEKAPAVTTPQPVEPLDEVHDLAGFLIEKDNMLYLRESDRDDVLDALQAKAQDDGHYQVSIDDGSGEHKEFPITLEYTDYPYLYADALSGILPDTLFNWMFVKVFVNASCGDLHKGFTSDCIATFGRHRQFGQSMIWRIDDWKSCRRGEGTCVEVLRAVGDVTYHPDDHCQDTLFTRISIPRFACK